MNGTYLRAFFPRSGGRAGVMRHDVNPSMGSRRPNPSGDGLITPALPPHLTAYFALSKWHSSPSYLISISLMLLENQPWLFDNVSSAQS